MRVIEWGGRPAVAMIAALFLIHPRVEAAESELDKVREMLRIDTARALAAERARQAPAPRSAAAPARHGDKIVLTSLYGLSGGLNAVVLVNGESRLYRQGSELPRGTTHPGREYRLQRIDDGCVYLKKGAEERSACIPPAVPMPAAAAGAGSAGMAPVPAPAPAMLPMLVPALGARP